ncbi:8750_t:CDS:1, partial [Scutellospora calospora]
ARREVAELDEDDVEQYVRNKFKNLNEMENYILSKKPKKPAKGSHESQEEYKEKNEGKDSHFY